MGLMKAYTSTSTMRTSACCPEPFAVDTLCLFDSSCALEGRSRPTIVHVAAHKPTRHNCETRRTMIARVDRNEEVVQDAQRADSAMRQHWKNAVCKEFKVPSHYQSVAVLLIHWAKRFDEQLQCGAEVRPNVTLISSWLTNASIRPQNSRKFFVSSMDSPQRR